MDDEQAGHERVEPVVAGEAQGQRRDDRDGEERTEGDQPGGEEEEDPGRERHIAAHQPHAPVHQHVDGAVVLGELEEIGETHERDEQVDRKARERVLDPEASPNLPNANAATKPRRPMLTSRHVPTTNIAASTMMLTTSRPTLTPVA